MTTADRPPAAPARHPSALALHQYQLALATPQETESIGRHLSGCERCRADLGELAGDQRRFEREVFPQTREAILRRRSPLRWWRVALPALAAAASAWLLFAPRPPDLATKGSDAALTIFVARPNGAQAISDGQTGLHAGDRIRFVVRPAGQRHAVIASVDGAGQTTIYHPYGGGESAPLPAGARVELPGSIALDRTAGPERVFVVLAPRPFPTAAVTEALRKLASAGPAALRTTATLPMNVDSATQQSVLFEKSP
jgi:hypothetical protein